MALFETREIFCPKIIYLQFILHFKVEFRCVLITFTSLSVLIFKARLNTLQVEAFFFIHSLDARLVLLNEILEVSLEDVQGKTQLIQNCQNPVKCPECDNYFERKG
ncbi:hypothetical protein BpHYR1_005228 [Brachionus plicatilis]|uniref:Uncharacterized protein n=1 Tax=Brachionus plicatilis TaxID=10195 RepID=A0A3M7SA66_BRAPC|nr:hypothetical protein BpHYR1_005228 [Brachionus plicatilis]